MKAKKIKQELRKQLKALGFDREKDPATSGEAYILLGPIYGRKCLVTTVSFDNVEVKITVNCDNVMFHKAVYLLKGIENYSIEEIFGDFFRKVSI